MPLAVHTKPHDVYKTVAYAINKSGAIVIGGTIVSESPSDIAREILVVQPLNRDIKRQVYHGKLSIEKGMTLSDELWEVIVQDFRDAMGYEEHPFILPRHTDQDHDHTHPIWARTNEAGQCIHDSWDHYKAQTALREIEERYELPKLQFSWETSENAPSFAEVHRAESQQVEYEQGIRKTLPDPSIRKQLLALIQSHVQDTPPLPTVIERLQQNGVEVRAYLDLPKKGISFQLNGVKFKGSSLGRGYSFQGLQNHFQVTYEPECDDQRIVELTEQAGTTLETELEQTAIAPPQQDESEWQSVQQLMQPYQFPQALIHHLYQEQMIWLDRKKRLTFTERTLEDSKIHSLSLTTDNTWEETAPLLEHQDSSFWLVRGESIEKIVVASNPLDAIAAYCLEQNQPQAESTLYIAADRPEQIPTSLRNLAIYAAASNQVDSEHWLKQVNHKAQLIHLDHAQGWLSEWQRQQNQESTSLSVVSRTDSEQSQLEL